MANGTRSPAVVLALVVGLAAGCLIGCKQESPPAPPPSPSSVPSPSPTPTCAPAVPRLIMIGPEIGKVSEKDAAISFKEGHKVLWLPQNDKDRLEITFRVENFPPGANGQPPFEGGKPGQPQVIKRNLLGAYKPLGINPELKGLIPDCPGFYYKYYQKLIHSNGKEEETDAGIIIER